MIALPGYLQRDVVRITFRHRVLQYVDSFQAEHHRSPQQKEIAHGVGIASAASVWRALKLLERDGYISRVRTQIEILRRDRP